MTAALCWIITYQCLYVIRMPCNLQSGISLHSRSVILILVCTILGLPQGSLTWEVWQALHATEISGREKSSCKFETGWFVSQAHQNNWLFEWVKDVFFFMYGLLTKWEVKMAGYWPSSFFACLWTEAKSRSINSQKKNEANIQPSWPNKLGQ